jgi:hypothetical protein
MENPLGLIRNQIYRLFTSKPKNEDQKGEVGPSLQSLKAEFPWASESELEFIKKEKLYLDADFTGSQE